MDHTFQTKIQPNDISFGSNRVREAITLSWSVKMVTEGDGVTSITALVPDQEMSLIYQDADAFGEETKQEFLELKGVRVVYDREGAHQGQPLGLYPVSIDIHGEEVEVRFSISSK